MKFPRVGTPLLAAVVRIGIGADGTFASTQTANIPVEERLALPDLKGLLTHTRERKPVKLYQLQTVNRTYPFFPDKHYGTYCRRDGI